jgi:hypothetical protein
LGVGRHERREHVGPKNIAQLARVVVSDTERTAEFWSDPVWVEIENFDGTRDLYQVTGFKQHTCQPTFELKHVERMFP